MFLNPQKALDSLDLRPGMTVADFGCGAGFYSIPLSKYVGDIGKVLAIDIRKEMLELVKSKAKLQHLLNIATIWADLEIPGSTHIRENSVDAIVISNILFQVENKANVAREAFRILKEGGEIMAVEWDESESPTGPPLKFRLTRRETERVFTEAGFIFKKEFSAGVHHYGFIFKKARNEK